MPDVELRARQRLGTVLKGKYRLDGVLGVGGMAAVYRATHRNGNRVAIKMLHLEFSLDEEMRARFVREGYVANGVDHPGVVRVIDDDVHDDGSVFVVMELLEGETLHARWARMGSKLPVAEVVRLTLDLLDVLIAAHVRTIVHRDIKPENLLITREGQLKVLDFGIARWREVAGSPTQSGMTLGTPAFMSPEQALGKSKEIDGRSDLWSVGATMFTLLSGQFVHEGETFQEMAVRAATRPASPLSTVSPETPAPIAAVVDRALLAVREQRWPSALAMKRALEDAWTRCDPHGSEGLPARALAGLDGEDERAPEVDDTLDHDTLDVDRDDALSNDETRELPRSEGTSAEARPLATRPELPAPRRHPVPRLSPPPSTAMPTEAPAAATHAAVSSAAVVARGRARRGIAIAVVAAASLAAIVLSIRPWQRGDDGASTTSAPVHLSSTPSSVATPLKSSAASVEARPSAIDVEAKPSSAGGAPTPTTAVSTSPPAPPTQSANAAPTKPPAPPGPLQIKPTKPPKPAPPSPRPSATDIFAP